MTPARLIDSCGFISALAYLWLARVSFDPPVGFPSFFSVLIVAWVALGIVYHRLSGEDAIFPVRRMVIWALVFRAIGLFAHPVLEDDHYRYLWDGRSFAVQGSPYLTAPADHFTDETLPDDFHQILDGINYPDVRTIYGPVCQVVFLVSYWIAPGSLIPIKLFLILADLATLWLLLQMIAPRRALIYAWCPLLIKETAFTSHIETLAIFLLVAAIYAYVRHRDVRVGIFAALAVAAKPIALLLLPVMAIRIRPFASLVFLGVLGAIYLPFASSGEGEGLGLFTFVSEWEFNSTGYALITASAGPTIARFAWGGVMTLLWLFLISPNWDEPDRTIPRGDWVFGCFLLFAPVANPWYLLWLLPFLAARPTAWGIAALFIVPVSYVHGLFLPDSGLAPYQHPEWIRPVEMGAIALAAFAQVVWTHWPQIRTMPRVTPPHPTP